MRCITCRTIKSLRRLFGILVIVIAVIGLFQILSLHVIAPYRNTTSLSLTLQT